LADPYAESTVRIQTERGHQVVERGPYRYIRHPMYVGFVAMHVAGPLIQGSWWALAVAVPIAVLFIVQTSLEDRALREELPGYGEYSMHTPYRLVPRVVRQEA
jgi:protein-S-isoprenylcysteine O-methyltransferase Ste14